MTEDVLQLLARSNPVAEDPGAPPIEMVMARIRSGAAIPDPPRPRRGGGVLLPSLGALAALAVVVAAFALAGHRGPRSMTGAGTALARGLPGVVTAGGTFAADGRGVIALDQCFPCRTRPQVQHAWTISTVNAGGNWKTRRTPFLRGLALPGFGTVQLGNARFGAQHGIWTIGTEPGDRPMRFDPWVSHDGGQSWARAHTPEPGFLGSISVAGETVWATATGNCTSRGCTASEVLRGPAGGHALTAVAPGPWLASSALRVAAGGPETAYVEVFTQNYDARTFVTHDGGRTWHPRGDVCHTNSPDLLLRVAGPRSVWQVCPVSQAPSVVVRSDDGGQSWHRYRVAFPNHGFVENLVPVSSTAAWALSDSGYVAVSSDGGASWRTVWSAGNYRPRAHLPSLSAISAARATITATQTSSGRTRVVVYRTHDDGATWQSQYVPLP